MQMKQVSCFGFNAIVASLALISGSAIANQYAEAPALTELVKAGQLPPVEQRLPENPLIVKPHDSIGQYGGTLNLLGLASDNGHRTRIIGHDNLFTFNTSYTGVVPGLASGFDANEDSTEYTIYLRKGVKWSDGSEFTASDITYFINDVLGDPEHAGNRPLNLKTPDAATAEAIDKYTVKITLKEPDGLFIRALAGYDGTSFVAYNRAYCSQFQPKFNKDAVKIAKEAGIANWRTYFEDKCSVHYFDGMYKNVDRPVLSAWKVKVPHGVNAPFALYERNPYYWQIDSEGNQLPYLDEVRWVFTEDKNDMVLRAIAGGTDFQARHVDAANFRSTIMENQERGGYTVQFRPKTDSTVLGFQINHTVKDPVKRELFANKEFRIALSIAMDREEMSESIFYGTAAPRQTSPLKMSEFYDKEMEQQYTEYNPDKANQILDSLGLDKYDEDGYRLMKNGKRLRIEFLTASFLTPAQQDLIELTKKQWKDVGVFLDMLLVDTQLMSTRRLVGDYDVLPTTMGGGIGIIDNVSAYAPTSPGADWGYGYYRWFQDPTHKDAVEPPVAVKEQLKLWKQLLATSSQDEQNRLMKDIVQIAKDQFFTIGTLTPIESSVIVSNKLRNAVEEMPASYNFPTPAPMRLGQLWKTANK